MRLKTHIRTIKDVMEDRKIYLDKVTDLCYNTLREYALEEGKKVFVKVEDINKYSVNSSTTEKQLKELTSTYEKMKLLFKETPVVIAGGAIRDTILGLEYRDIDVFVPEIVKEPFNDIEDSMTYDLLDVESLFPDYNPPVVQGVDFSLYPEKGFIVFNLNPHLGRFDKLPPTIQVIVREDYEGTPESLIKTFDWTLVEAYMDESGVYISQDFIDALKRKRVTFKDSASRSRALRWKDRHHSNFKITFGRPTKEKTEPKVMDPESIKTFTTASGNTYTVKLNGTAVPDWAQVNQARAVTALPMNERVFDNF